MKVPHLPGPSAPLSAAQIADNFSDLHAPLSGAQVSVEAARCLYCYDAPCIRACPTAIDIPKFIHQLRSGNIRGSGVTILSANILGGTCARACPTEVLCEGACVVNQTEGAPVKIGLLQRAAVDHVMAAGGPHPFVRAPASGKRLAAVGAGPASLAFAHRAALLGHEVELFEAKPKPGGLNEYGLAAYKMVEEFAAREAAFLLEVGGVKLRHGVALGRDITLEELLDSYDAVFLGLGLSEAARLGAAGEDLPGVLPAIDFIEGLRQAADKATLAIGREVIIIGGGNTAIDAAVQAKRLGAEQVTLVYRRGRGQMGATPWEQEFAAANGVALRFWAQPVAFEGEGRVEAVRFARMREEGGRLLQSQAGFTLPADQVLVAVGQKLADPGLGALRRERGKLWVDAGMRTSHPKVFAGGDCVLPGEDLTVQAVEDGKRAALSVDAQLRGQGG